MKQTFRRIMLVCSLLCVGIQAARAEVIRSFSSDVRLQKDSTLDVTETIVMDFEGASRHGIYRDMPVKYQRHDNTYSIYVKVLSITDENNNPLQYKTSEQGQDLNIRIGNGDTLITGVHTYKLHYTVLRAVNFYNGEPEVYWNATGDQWPFAMQQAVTRFYPPSGVSISQLTSKSYLGSPGSKAPASLQNEANDVAFYTNNLNPGDELTFAVRLPQGSVVPPSIMQTFWWYFVDWWPAFIAPLLALLILLSLYLRGGRDIDGNQAVAVEWAPPSDLSPAEVGTLIDEHCDMSDIISTLLDLAARGYLQIHENESKGLLFLSSKDYTFVRNAPDPVGDKLAKHEKEFLDGIFEDSIGSSLEASLIAEIAARQQARPQSAPPLKQALGANAFGLADPAALLTAGVVSTKSQTVPPVAQPQATPPPAPVKPMPTNQAVQLSDLKEKFYTHIAPIKKSVFDELMSKNLFVHNPEDTRGQFKGAALICGFAGFVLFTFSLPWAIGLLISAALIYLSMNAMPARTATGSRKLRECEGFARFVKLVEKPRLEMMHNENPEIFGRLLPYAVVLGVADQWAEGFKDLMTEPPSWYYPYNYGAGYLFSPMLFMHDMGNGMNTMSNTFQSVPTSSSAGAGGGFSGISGGFSGGGFGGGGGGSW
ncbi:MAG: DUF2207 domain-containing protein [Abditibacteriaceae bacterium]